MQRWSVSHRAHARYPDRFECRAWPVDVVDGRIRRTMEASSIHDVAYIIAVIAMVVVPRAVVAYLGNREESK